MSHDHGHHHGHHHHGTSNISVAFFLNFAFTIIEIIGGLMTNSLAILSDALHDLGDTLSLGMSWYMEKVSKKKRDRHFSYGYKRFSMLAALINSVVLIVGSIVILWAAIPRLLDPQPVDAKGMMILACLGVLVNGAAVLKVRRGKTMNEKVVTWHLVEDVLGWVVVLIIGLIMLVVDAPILDPLFSMAFTTYILWNVVKNLKQTLMLLLQSIPPEIDMEAIKSKICGDPLIQSMHDTHIWSMDGAYHVLTTHLVLVPSVTTDQMVQLKQKARQTLKNFDVEHATIEIEQDGESCQLKEC